MLPQGPGRCERASRRRAAGHRELSGSSSPGSPQEVAARKSAETELERTAVAAFNDAQRTWGSSVDGYRPARLVLFWDEVRSGCGGASAEVGPFYCPADERVYIDLGFYRELAARFGAPGRFAQKRATGRVSPESFTHGSSEQRTRWFRAGFEAGTLRACDTFGGEP